MKQLENLIDQRSEYPQTIKNFRDGAGVHTQIWERNECLWVIQLCTRESNSDSYPMQLRNLPESRKFFEFIFFLTRTAPQTEVSN